MSKKRSLIFFILMCLTSVLCAQQKPEKKSSDTPVISESLGHLIGKNLKALDLPLDIDLVIKGIHDSLLNKLSPLSEEDCVQAISTLQEKKFDLKAKENLKIADNFLKKNKIHKNVIELEPGKLQYKITTKGEGQIVKEYNNPLVRYTGKYLDGTVFSSTIEAEKISLDQTIPGFSKAIIGMREGEKRIVYIHPELGYGKSGFLEPNSLLQFEIELIQANHTSLNEKEQRQLLSEQPSGNLR